MSPYEAIFTRKSVRDFQKTAITEQDKAKIQEYIEALVPLYPDQKWEIQLVEEHQAISGLFRVHAPMYLVFYGENESEESCMNAGYLLENLLLVLHAKGISSCYQGGAHIKKKWKDTELTPLMIVAIGYAEGEAERKLTEFKRKPMKKLVIIREPYNNDVELMLEAARLAPSAMNVQPWSFVVYHNRIHVFMETKHQKAPMHLVDMGICMAHLAMAAEELWVEGSFTRVESLAEKKIQKYSYMTTMIMR